jgi:hypothetical protein
MNFTCHTPEYHLEGQVYSTIFAHHQVNQNTLSRQPTTDFAWQPSNERGCTQPPHQSLSQLPEATMEVRPLAPDLPEVFVVWRRVSGLSETFQVEQRGRLPREDDGKVVRRAG